MNVEYMHWHSHRLGQKFECKVYGEPSGTPMIAFPSAGGHFWDYEDNGMIQAVAHWIDNGRLQVFAADGRDWESWANTSISGHDRAVRADVWDDAICNELVPLMHKINANGNASRRLIVTGCSGGAFHAANFIFRHPDLCDTAICLSGVYATKDFRTDHVDDYDYSDPLVYFNNPLRYLKDLHDEWYLSRLRDSRIIICCGQGAWEEECLAQSRQLSAELRAKNVPHWLDLWGHDVNHDWPWWRVQIGYFLGRLEL